MWSPAGTIFSPSRRSARPSPFSDFCSTRALVSLRLCLKAADVGPAGLVQEVIERYATSGKNTADLADILEGLQTPQVSDNLQKFIELVLKYGPLVLKEKPQMLIESWMIDSALSGCKCMELLLNTAVLHESMSSLLQNLLLGRESDVVRSGGRRYRPTSVSLMTLHWAKALNFRIVPVRRQGSMIPFKSGREVGNPERKRRLFYVGLTRARDELILLTSPARSPFLADIAEDCLIAGEAFARKQTPAEQLSLFNI
jgi:superfamily I DNA/RNA helicase